MVSFQEMTSQEINNYFEIIKENNFCFTHVIVNIKSYTEVRNLFSKTIHGEMEKKYFMKTVFGIKNFIPLNHHL